MATNTLPVVSGRFAGLTDGQVLMLFEKIAVTAANESVFLPPEWSDDDFVQWALHIMIRLKNLAPGAPEYLMRRAIFHAGTPSPEWAAALVFMMTLPRTSKRKALTA